MQKLELTKISKEEFLVSDSDVNIPADPNRLSHALPHYESGVGKLISDIGDGYAIHQFREQLTDVLLLHNGQVVGAYVTDVLDIDPLHVKKGLSTPLILAAVSRRELPQSRILSTPGRAALSVAWEVANGHKESKWPISF